MSIQQTTAELLQKVNVLSNACRKRYSQLPDVKVLAVTKNQDSFAIRAALEAGITAIAENRVQEAIKKYVDIKDLAEWHFIGHLQTNKVKQIIPFCHLIHSVDRQSLAIEIDKASAKINKCQNILIQINVSGEDTKFGLPPKQVMQMTRFLASLENIRLCGCMTIAPLTEDVEKTRPIFRELFYLFQEIQSLQLPNTRMEWLSMGMTNDYMVAIEEGANLIRIGTGIFGKRG